MSYIVERISVCSYTVWRCGVCDGVVMGVRCLSGGAVILCDGVVILCDGAVVLCDGMINTVPLDVTAAIPQPPYTSYFTNKQAN